MKAVLLKDFGDVDQLYLGETEAPALLDHSIRVKVVATALNRADTLQRKGFYPPPPGASSVLGLEMAGDVIEVGVKVTKWKIGDRVFGLLAGGGYAEQVVIHEDVAMPMPDEMTYIDAAAIPEVFLTAFQALSYLAKLQPSEQVLIHAGASGVGTAAIQLAKAMGAGNVIVTASKGKHQICKDLGADYPIDYANQDFQEEVAKITDGKGVDVIMDFLAAAYFQKNINSLNFDGRMIMLAMMGGMNLENVNIANILRKRIRIIGSTLRARSLDYKIGLTRDFSTIAMTWFADGTLKPVVDSIYSWSAVKAAHRHMEANKNKGKIIMTID